MKYLILEKQKQAGCDYTIGCGMNWKIIESDLPYEQFKYRAAKYALFGGDSKACPSDYDSVDDRMEELHIIELPTLLTVDLEEYARHFETLIKGD